MSEISKEVADGLLASKNELRFKEEDRRRAVALEPESQTVGQLNLSVKILREENYQQRLRSQAAEAEAKEMRRERNEARNHLDGMTRSRDAAREENRKMVEAEKKLKAISIEGQRHQLEYLKHMAERLLSDVSSLLAPAKEP